MLSKPPKKINKNGGIRVISRAAQILRALKQDDRGMSLGDIAERVGLPRSSVQRLVNALIAEGLVVASSAERGLRLGPEIQALAAASQAAIGDLIRPILEELSQKTAETVDLSVFRDDHMLFVDQVVGTHRLRAVSAVGEIFPMTTTANGKATLSLLDAPVVDAIAARELEAKRGSKKKMRQLRVEIGQARRAGYALDLDEHTEGISAVGAAFTTQAGPIYAISIPAPSYRFGKRRGALAEALLGALERVRAMV
jgi:DNA-binding IclR family transcriptional regulator